MVDVMVTEVVMVMVMVIVMVEVELVHYLEDDNTDIIQYVCMCMQLSRLCDY